MSNCVQTHTVDLVVASGRKSTVAITELCDTAIIEMRLISDRPDILSLINFTFVKIVLA